MPTPRVTLGDPIDGPAVTPVLDANDGKFYISCSGIIQNAGFRTLQNVYAKAYAAALDPIPMEPPTGSNPVDGQILTGTKTFQFLGSKHPSGDGTPRLIPLPVDPDTQSTQYLYVWALMSGSKWADPAEVIMNLSIMGMTASGDTEP